MVELIFGRYQRLELIERQRKVRTAVFLVQLIDRVPGYDLLF